MNFDEKLVLKTEVIVFKEGVRFDEEDQHVKD